MHHDTTVGKLIAVSYTHLDVYKRQGKGAGGSCLVAGGRRIPARGTFSNAFRSAAAAFSFGNQ